MKARLVFPFCLALFIVMNVVACGGSSKSAASASSTAIAPVSAPEGWKKLEVSGLTMYVPPEYVGGEPNAADYDLIISRVRSAGNEAGAKQLEALRGSNSFRTLLVGRNGTSIAIAQIEEVSTVTLGRHVDLEVQQLPASSLESREPVTLGPVAAERLTLTQGEAKYFQYYIKQGTSVWIVQYASPASGADAQRTDFEKSAQTIRMGAGDR